MERVVQKSQVKPQEKFRDGMYKTEVTEIKEFASQNPSEPTNGFFLLTVKVHTVEGEKSSSLTLPIVFTPKNKHARFYQAVMKQPVEVGMPYNPEDYKGKPFEAWWEWDAAKMRMKADKFRAVE